MKKTAAFVAAIVLLVAITAPVMAQDKPATDSLERYLGLTYDFSYHTQWLSKGAQGYGTQGAVFNTLDLDLFQTGFGFQIIHRNATESGYVDKQRIDWRPYYKNSAFKDERYQIDYMLSTEYEHYYGLARAKANTTLEWIFGFRFPNICPGIIPYYIVHYEYPVSGGDVNRMVSGWIHRFGMDVPIKNPDLPIPLIANAEVAYYGHLGNTTNDWAYAHFGLSSKIKLAKNIDFVPRVYQQISFDDAVNDSDPIYGVFSFAVRFK